MGSREKGSRDGGDGGNGIGRWLASENWGSGKWDSEMVGKGEMG